MSVPPESARASIAGLGTDLVEIERIATSLHDFAERFIERIAHPEDRVAAPDLQSSAAAPYWAARFATKEAFSKALGTGIGAVVGFQDVGVRRCESGRPEIVVSDRLQTELNRRGIGAMHISLTHTAHTAMAVVILERG